MLYYSSFYDYFNIPTGFLLMLRLKFVLNVVHAVNKNTFYALPTITQKALYK